MKVLVEIAPDVTNPSFGNTATFNGNEFEAQELNIVHDGTNVSILEYGKLTTSLGGLSATGFGTYTAYLDGSNIKLDFNPSGIGTNAVVNTIVVGLSSITSGISTVDLKHARLQSTMTTILHHLDLQLKMLLQNIQVIFLLKKIDMMLDIS